MSTISISRKAGKLTFQLYGFTMNIGMFKQMQHPTKEMNLEEKKRRALSRFLKKVREERGWSQREFARRIGVTHATLNSWESAKTTADTKNIEKIANVLTMTAWEVQKVVDENVEPDVDIEHVLDLIDRLAQPDVIKVNMFIAGKLAKVS